MKKLLLGRRRRLPTFKYDLKMKLTTILLLSIVFCMNANNGYSQKTRITMDVVDAKVDQVLDEIERTTEFKFIYNVKHVDLNRRVSIKVDQLLIHNLLNSLFHNTETTYKVRGKQIILSKMEHVLPPLKTKSNPKEAQKKIKVSGKVVDDLGLPLPGVSIVEKGTTNGTASDFDGGFEISVDEGATLVFTSIGFLEVELPASIEFMNISLKESASELDEVIVVAQGISKSKKALGYSVSKVDTQETEGRPETDISRTLQGKISGVQISAPNGSSGAATSITVRGNLSLTGTNQALIVLDNIPYDGNLLDIDPNDIKNITVLKGLNAAVLYGSEGRNGVILIETKSGNAALGKKSFSLNVSHTSYANQIANLPEFQNEYGVGNNFNTNPGTVGNSGSWGARFSDVETVPHPLANNPSFSQFAGVEVPYVAAPNNVSDFFRTGVGQNFALNAVATGENASFSFSTGYTGEDGIIGNNDFKRFNINVGGTARLNDKIVVSSSVGYSTRTRNSQVGSFLFNRLWQLPRSLDIHNLPYQDPQTGENVFYRNGNENPLWTINNTGRDTKVDRVTASLNLSYKLNDHHTLKYRGGLQTEVVSFIGYRNRGGRFDGVIGNSGVLDIDSSTEFVVDNTFILASEYDITETLGFSSQLGVNSRLEVDKSTSSRFTDQIVFGFLRPSNFRNNADAGYSEGRDNLAGFFGQFDFDYKNYLYLGLSGRYDISSTLERENQTLFYPGVSLSFIPTSAFNFGGNTINFLKLRGAYATSAGFPGRYRTRNSLASDPREFEDLNDGLIITNSLLNTLANPNIKPELHREFELGLEANLLNNAVTLNASVFKRISENQIFNTSLPPATGFTNTNINAGRLDTEGLEIDLGVKLFKNKAFNWNVRNVFTSFVTEVVELPNDLERVVLDSSGEVEQVAILGKPLGTYIGTYVVRDDNGTPLVNPTTGELLVSGEVGLDDEIIGNFNPDWRATSIHNFSYKNFSLSCQLEYTHGGTRTSRVVEELFERGVIASTADREGTFVVPGIYGNPATGEPILDVNGNTIPNTTQEIGNRVVFSNYYNSEEGYTFDASLFRIREISLSYNLDSSVTKKLPFDSIVFTLTGRNVFHKAPNFPKAFNMDPEVVDNDFPTTSRYAFGVSINF
ncbi:SusC/RagA family TonB-linked outer membrane protein [Hyunsoonleella ulvae]|uniref:SusC/RagA family TonB-linked outer membrane protein n=1 Tax=Hyunsoonleella ulvae TaxID=2799948 RepID=UPI001939A499|nr:SusC/RagA family TonB-linked outer membrane protein [Hyunsoonleella ulvae]